MPSNEIAVLRLQIQILRDRIAAMESGMFASIGSMASERAKLAMLERKLEKLTSGDGT